MTVHVSPYRVLQSVHQGLYGAILQAEDSSTHQRVALQILSGARAAGPYLAAQVGALRKLAMPRVCTPLGSGLHNEGAFIAWEWAEGQPLPVPAPTAQLAVSWAQQLAAILEEAHRHGFVHLFLRPSQVLLSPERGRPEVCALLGLGVARALGRPVCTLSPAVATYLAPEFYTGEQLDSGAADVYSLGQLLGALLAPPVPIATSDGRSARGALARAQQKVVSELIERMVRPRPAERPSMPEVNAALQGLIKPRAQSPSATMAPLLATPTLSGASDADPLLGQSFGSFRLVRCLGRGGMGAVYEATHRVIGTRAVVKVMHPDLVSDDYARRFLDEARAVNIIDHPGVVSIFEFGQRPEDGRLYIIMEYLPGTTLAGLLEQHKAPLPVAEVLQLGLQIARALEEAHRRHVIHRDLKPSNVMLVPDPLVAGALRVKVVDFGIAKLDRSEITLSGNTRRGAVMGTPSYMAPEQYGRAHEVTGKADVFALGVMLYEALAGHRPFGEEATVVVLQRPAPRLRAWGAGIPGSLVAMVAAMLQAKADARPTMSEVVARLQRLCRPRVGRWLVPLVAGSAAAAGLGLVGLLLTRPPSLAEVEARYDRVRERASTVLITELTTQRPGLERVAAAQALGDSRDPVYRPRLIPLTRDPDRQIVCTGSRALSALGEAADGALIGGLLEAPDVALRACAASALAELTASPESTKGRASALALLRDPRLLAASDGASVRAELAAALLRSGAAEANGAPEDGAAGVLEDELSQALLSPALRGAERLHYAELCAERTGGTAALAQLRQIAEDPARPPAETLGAMASLVRLGKARPEEAQRVLATAERPGPNQLLAAWLRARKDGVPSCELFARTVVADSEAEERRQLAADGLSRCGAEYAMKLDRLLDPLEDRPLLRIAVADTLLRMVGPDWQHAAEAQQRFARSYQRGAPLAERLAFLDTAPQLPAGTALSELTRVVREEPDDKVRRTAARMLGAGRVQRVLSGLTQELSDANTDVYQRGLRAVKNLLEVVESAPGTQLEGSVRAHLHERLRDSTDVAEQIVLRSLLTRYGERDQSTQLLRQLPKLDRVQQLLAVELSEPRSGLAAAALGSTDPAVRFAAARHRAVHGVLDPATRQALTGFLDQPGQEALLAYFLLRSLGDSPARPKHLPDLLGRGEPLPVRWDVVRLLAQLPLDEALPLLQRASIDPAAVIRREVVVAAWAQYQRTRAQRMADLIVVMANDEEQPVRLKVSQILRQMSSPTKAQAAPMRPAAPDAAQERKPEVASARPPDLAEPIEPEPAPSTVPAEPRRPSVPVVAPAHLAVVLPAGASARLIGSGAPREVIKSRELDLPAGRYRLSSSCDEPLTVMLRTGERKSVQPCELPEALEQARSLRTAGRLPEAQAVITDLLRRLRGREQSLLYERARYERGELHAASGRLREALEDYNLVWSRHLGQSVAGIPGIAQKLTLLRSRVGRLTVYRQSGERCVLVEDSLQMPGQIRTALLTEGFSIRAGEHLVKPEACQPGRAP